MILSDEQQKEFEALSRPLIKFLNDHCNPHTKIIIDTTSAELNEGCLSLETLDYLKD